MVKGNIVLTQKLSEHIKTSIDLSIKVSLYVSHPVDVID